MCVLAASFVVLLDIFTEQRGAGGREIDNDDEVAAPPLTSEHTSCGAGGLRWCARLRPVPAPASSAESVSGEARKSGWDVSRDGRMDGCSLTLQ